MTSFTADKPIPASPPPEPEPVMVCIFAFASELILIFSAAVKVEFLIPVFTSEVITLVLTTPATPAVPPPPADINVVKKSSCSFANEVIFFASIIVSLD